MLRLDAEPAGTLARGADPLVAWPPALAASVQNCLTFVAQSCTIRRIRRRSVVELVAAELPRLRPGGHLDCETAARRWRQPHLRHELRHELELLGGDGEPGRGLDVAGRCLQDDRGFCELPLGLDPAAVGLAIGGERRPVDLGQQPDRVEAPRETLPFGLGGRRQMRRTGWLGGRRLRLVAADRSPPGGCRAGASARSGSACGHASNYSCRTRQDSNTRRST
jgi:hypothetical protein